MNYGNFFYEEHIQNNHDFIYVFNKHLLIKLLGGFMQKLMK